MANVIISAHGGQELRELGRRLKEAGRKDLQKKFRGQVKDAARPVIADIRAAALGINVTRGSDEYVRRTRETGVAPRRSTGRWGPRSTGLRARLAKATTVSQTRKGIRIKVSEKRFGPYGVTLPRRLDATLPKYKKLRHPVFGNPEVWVEHIGEPYFLNVIARHRSAFRKALFEAIEEMKKELDR